MDGNREAAKDISHGRSSLQLLNPWLLRCSELPLSLLHNPMYAVPTCPLPLPCVSPTIFPAVRAYLSQGRLKTVGISAASFQLGYRQNPSLWPLKRKLLINERNSPFS